MNTKFQDMTNGQRSRWIEWCFTHDWCVSAGQNGCRQFFVETQDGDEITFATPQALRNWAGY